MSKEQEKQISRETPGGLMKQIPSKLVISCVTDYEAQDAMWRWRRLGSGRVKIVPKASSFSLTLCFSATVATSNHLGMMPAARPQVLAGQV
ncbi:hypothetical protein ACLKA7_008616 [Drosophila subpalustris]